MNRSYIKILSLVMVILIAFAPLGAVYAEDEETASLSVDIVNNAGISDTVTVSNLAAGDIVRVYLCLEDDKKGRLIGSAVVAAKKTEAVVTIPQLGDEGAVFISVTSPGTPESTPVKVTYASEAATVNIDSSYVEVNNNFGINDSITVSGLQPGDIVKIYATATGGTVIGKGTVPSGKSAVTINTNQLGEYEGTIYVSVTSKGKLESGRTTVGYDKEQASGELLASNIEVKNNVGTNDIIEVKDGVTSGDIVRVYAAATGGNPIAIATVPVGAHSVKMTVAQVGVGEGSVYVSVKNPGNQESSRVEVRFEAEEQSAKLSEADAAATVVVNNAGASDLVRVHGVKPGDLVRIYADETSTTPMGSAKSTGSEFTDVKVPQVGTDGGSIYITLTSSTMSESKRAKVEFIGEGTSTAPVAANIIVTNNALLKDTVEVGGLKAKDIVNVYTAATDGNSIGKAVAGTDGKAVVSIAQLGTGAGSVYVTVTTPNFLESSRTKADYAKEEATDVSEDVKITVKNNFGIKDTVTVTGLGTGDVVKVYAEAGSTAVLGTATAGKDGSAVVSISQLGVSGGSVYVTVTTPGNLESDRTKADFTAETASESLKAADITVANNTGKADTVTVVSLGKGDVIYVYASEIGGGSIGKATAGVDGRAAANIAQLGTLGGSVYVSVARVGYQESDRTKQDYLAENVSAPPVAANISIDNNSGAKDIVSVGGLTEGDVVKVYQTATSTPVLGTATVKKNDHSVDVSVTQVGTGTGSIYVTVTSKGMLESARVAQTYAAEGVSDVLSEDDITVRNNFGANDTITVKNITKGDIIKVYSVETNGTALGTATVASGKTEATVSIPQLGVGEGEIYVSIIRATMSESDRTKKEYSAEGVSVTPDPAKMLIINNIGSDIIVVYGLQEKDLVKVYGSSDGGAELAKGTVAAGQTHVILTVKQLGAAGGTVYISVTSPGYNESNLIPKTFSKE